VRYAEAPAIIPSAREILKSGEERFKEKYGDYFIGGMILGAEAGMMLSQSQEDRRETEVGLLRCFRFIRN
jgi:hypothetical protein